MKLLKTNDFLDKAIADANKKVEYHLAKSNQALMLDANMTVEGLSDPKMKPKWDAYFKKSQKQIMKEFNEHLAAEMHYHQVIRDLKNIQMFHNRI